MNEFVILIKDTSLIIAMGLTAAELDIYNLAREGYSDDLQRDVLHGGGRGRIWS